MSKAQVYSTRVSYEVAIRGYKITQSEPLRGTLLEGAISVDISYAGIHSEVVKKISITRNPRLSEEELKKENKRLSRDSIRALFNGDVKEFRELSKQRMDFLNTNAGHGQYKETSQIEEILKLLEL